MYKTRTSVFFSEWRLLAHFQPILADCAVVTGGGEDDDVYHNGGVNDDNDVGD